METPNATMTEQEAIDSVVVFGKWQYNQKNDRNIFKRATSKHWI